MLLNPALQHILNEILSCELSVQYRKHPKCSVWGDSRDKILEVHQFTHSDRKPEERA